MQRSNDLHVGEDVQCWDEEHAKTLGRVFEHGNERAAVAAAFKIYSRRASCKCNCGSALQGPARCTNAAMPKHPERNSLYHQKQSLVYCYKGHRVEQKSSRGTNARNKSPELEIAATYRRYEGAVQSWLTERLPTLSPLSPKGKKKREKKI